MRRFLQKNGSSFGLSSLEFEGCYYMTFRLDGTREEFLAALATLARDPIDCDALVSPAEQPLFDKFDPFIPGELLRRAYARDRLRPDEAEARIDELLQKGKYKRGTMCLFF